MFCPNCGSEYRTGFAECADCHVALVDVLPPPLSEVREADAEWVTVFESSDPAMIALARSILESSEISFMTSGEPIQDLFGAGRFPGMMNIVVGPVQFKVEEKDADESERLLEELSPAEDNMPATEQLTPESLMVETRLEEPPDYDAVYRLHQSAFGGDREAVIVDRVRQQNHAVLSMVAEVGGEVVGHIMFSPITVQHAFEGFRGLGLAPVAVLPEYQKNGIGSKLIRDGVQHCRDLGYAAIVLVGNPDFYRRFGFGTASDYGLTNEYGVHEEFMIMALRDAVVDRLNGLVRFVDEFRDGIATE